MIGNQRRVVSGRLPFRPNGKRTLTRNRSSENLGREDSKALRTVKEEQGDPEGADAISAADHQRRPPLKLPQVPGAAPREETNLRTPAVLYRGEFQLSNQGGGGENDWQHHDPGLYNYNAKLDKKRNTVPRVSGTQPDWYVVQMRLCKCKSPEEQAVVEDTVRHILKSGVEMASRDPSRPLCNLPLTDKPTSRLQTRMLAAWFGTQIATLAEHGFASHSVMLSLKDGKGKNGELVQAAKAVPEYVDQMADRLIQTWETADMMPKPFIYFDTNIVRVEGVKVPNDKRYLQAMLQVTSSALALVTHQVGMHCRERGFLLAHIWNLHLGLQEFQMEQLKLHAQGLRAEKHNLEARVARVDMAVHQQAEEELQRLRDFEEFANLKMTRLERENEVWQKDVAEIDSQHAKQLIHHEMRIFQLENELEELDVKLTETEGELDIAIAALTAKGEDGDDSQASALKRVRGNLSKGIYKQLDGLRGNANDDTGPEGEERRKNLVMSQMASAELLDQLSTIAHLLNLNGKDGAISDLKANDSEAMQLLELIIKFRERTGAETIGDLEKDALLDEWDKVEDQVDDMALKVLQGAGNMEKLTLEELIEKSGITLPEVALDPVFMDDVDEMKRDQMYDEIKILREREQAMLQLMSKMAELYSAEANNPPECQFCGKKPIPEGGDDGKGGKGKKKKKMKKKSSLKKSASQSGAGAGSGSKLGGETEDASEDESGGDFEASDFEDSEMHSTKPRAAHKVRSKKASFGHDVVGSGADYDEEADYYYDDEEEERGESRGEMLGMMAAMTMGLVKHRETEIEQRKVVARKNHRAKSKQERARQRSSASSIRNLMAENEYEEFLDDIEDGDDVPAASGVKQALKRSASGGRGMMSANNPAFGGSDEEDDADVPTTHPSSNGLASTKKLGRSRRSLKSLESRKSMDQSNLGDFGSDGGAGKDAMEGGAISARSGRSLVSGKKSKSAAGGRAPGAPEAMRESEDDVEPPAMTAEETEEASNQLERLIARIKTKKPELLKGFDIHLLLRMQKQVAESGGIGPPAGGNAGIVNILTGGGKKGAGGNNAGKKGQAKGAKRSQGAAGAKGAAGARQGIEQVLSAPHAGTATASGGIWPDQAHQAATAADRPSAWSPERARGVSGRAGDSPTHRAISLNSPSPAANGAADIFHNQPTPRDRIGQKIFATTALRDSLKYDESQNGKIDLSPDKEAAKKAPERSRFQAKDKSLLSALSAHPNASPRTPEWAIKVIEGIYKTLSEKVASSKKASQVADINMPKQLMAHFASQYGTKTIVEEYAAQMIATLKKHASKDTRLQIFSKFLSEDWGVPVVEHFLEAVHLAQTAGSIAVPCIEYPRQKRGAAFICAVKATVIAEHMLMKRPEEVAAAFEATLRKISVPAEDKEKSVHFWAPGEGITLQSVEEASGPMMKIPLHEFLSALCQEFTRLEDDMETVLPDFYKMLDETADGFMSRSEIDQIKSITGGTDKEVDQLWEACLAAKGPEEGTDSGLKENEINFALFQQGCMNHRVAVVRRYMRLNKSTPARLDDEGDDSEGGIQMQVKGIVKSVWEEMESSVEEILQDDTFSAEEGSLRLQINRVSTGDEDKAAAFTKLVRSLITYKFDSCLKEWRQLHSSEDISALENTLRAMASALAALYRLDPASGGSKERPALSPPAGVVDAAAAAAPEAGAEPAANENQAVDESLQISDQEIAESREAGSKEETAGTSVDASAAPEGGQDTGDAVPDGAATPSLLV